jgi:hypothetical protein
MELLLNLIWIALTIGSFVIVIRRQRRLTCHPTVPSRSLLALACVLFLLFPIISASDDLHPTQALMEEAAKRVQHFASPLHFPAGNSAPHLLPMLLLGLLFMLVKLQPLTVVESEPCLLEVHRIARNDRGPPFGCN